MRTFKVENSSQVDLVRYDKDTQTLDVVFKSKGGNKTYQYYKVQETIFDGIMSAESVGKYINEHVKGKFDYKLIPF